MNSSRRAVTRFVNRLGGQAKCGVCFDARSECRGVSSSVDAGQTEPPRVAPIRGTANERVVSPWPVGSMARTTSPGPNRRVVPSPIAISISPEKE